MTTNYIAIPVAAIEAPAYQTLSRAERFFLLELYIQFSDCQRFTLNFEGNANRAMLPRIKRLIDCGLLIVDESIKVSRNKFTRVFKFAHSAFDLSQAELS